MTFELESMTKVRVLDVRTLASKDRKPNELPGAQLLCMASLSHGVLAQFDCYLPGVLFRKVDAPKQGNLEGLEGFELSSVGEHVKRLPWVYEQTGCDVVIDFGAGGKRNLVLADVKVHRVSMQPQKGGSVRVQWTMDAPSLSTDTRGRLTDFKATDIQMTLTGPEVADDTQSNIGDDAGEKPAAPRKPGAPERAAVAKAGGDPGPAPAHKGDDAPLPLANGATLSPAAARPFPKNKPTEAPPQSATTEVVIERSQPGTRTARGRDKTAKALKAGAH